tara:strand:- start:207 stop:431 length:225 start_codon:yes stop_codon:yes gene_type:complete
MKVFSLLTITIFFSLLSLVEVALSSDCKIDYQKVCYLVGYKKGDNLKECIERIKSQEQINKEAEKDGLLDKKEC